MPQAALVLLLVEVVADQFVDGLAVSINRDVVIVYRPRQDSFQLFVDLCHIFRGKRLVPEGDGRIDRQFSVVMIHDEGVELAWPDVGGCRLVFGEILLETLVHISLQALCKRGSEEAGGAYET